MAPVTPAQIDNEIKKHLELVADLCAQQNPSFPVFRQIRGAAATKRAVAPGLAESGGSLEMTVLHEPFARQIRRNCQEKTLSSPVVPRNGKWSCDRTLACPRSARYDAFLFDSSQTDTHGLLTVCVRA